MDVHKVLKYEPSVKTQTSSASTIYLIEDPSQKEAR